MLIILGFLLGVVGSVVAKAIDIDVGKGASLSFAPSTVTASVGDTSNFHFYNGSGGHSVVSGPFSNPCEPGTDTFFSGYVKGDLTGDMTFIVTVNSTDPIWFYCSLEAHCIAGMVGVVNPPSGQTISDYIAHAAGFRAQAPSALQGGILTTLNPGSRGVTSITSSSNTVSSSSVATSTKPTSIASVAASSTPSGGGNSNHASVMLGLGILGGVFVALMS